MFGGQLEVLPPGLEIAFVRRRRRRVGQRGLRRRAALVRIRIAGRHGRRRRAEDRRLEGRSAARVKIQRGERLDEAPGCPGGRGRNERFGSRRRAGEGRHKRVQGSKLAAQMAWDRSVDGASVDDLYAGCAIGAAG